MRFFLKLDLENQSVDSIRPDFSIFNGILDERQEHVGENYYFYSGRYENSSPAISEYFYDHPFYENDHYIMIVSGSVYYRHGKDIAGRCVPTSQELLDIMITLRDDHYRHIKGNYYILLFEKRKATAVLYSSPFFLTPVYVHQNRNILILSNHLDFMISHMKTRAINDLALLEFTLFDHTLYTSTIIKDVYLVPGGHKVILKNEIPPQFTLVYDIVKWFNSRLSPREESLERINCLLHEVMNRYLQSTPKFNLSLTGGFDGRLNLAFVKENEYTKMKAFSYGMSGSNQLSIPANIADKLGFIYRPIYLDEQFADKYAELGLASIFLTAGVTGFNRAVYPYAYQKIGDNSKSCILGQCDMIRPLYNNPAGAIFNIFSEAILLKESFNDFFEHFVSLSTHSFIQKDYFSKSSAQAIYELIHKLYIAPYPELSSKERFYFFLYKESLMKYWHTECHLVNLFVDDFILFSDLDYIEALHASPFCGLYKGLLADNQLHRRKAHDLYVELTALNKPVLNNFYNDRYFKPKWLKYGILGFAVSGVGKKIAKTKRRFLGNDTFDEHGWPLLFYHHFRDLIEKNNTSFDLENINQLPAYSDNNEYRKERHLSLKLWLDNHCL